MICPDVVRVARGASDDIWSGALTVYVGGEMDMATAPALHAVAMGCLTRPQRLVVDLTNVSFMDSTARPS